MVVGLLAGLVAVPVLQLGPRAVADTLTMSTGASRSGWYANQPALAPSAINTADFGQLFSATLDGQVYAQPLVSTTKSIPASAAQWPKWSARNCAHSAANARCCA